MEGHHQSPIRACTLKKAPVEGVKLSGLCRCKETKENFKHSSIAFLMRGGKPVTLDEGSKIFCWEIGQSLPAHKNPPMKPPPIA